MDLHWSERTQCGACGAPRLMRVVLTPAVEGVEEYAAHVDVIGECEHNESLTGMSFSKAYPSC